ncbi:MAG TPA: response regulator transcription factor [Burkholderiales bacterium]|nr:response regulator transcription factor [Burkholderiales bacterium]
MNTAPAKTRPSILVVEDFAMLRSSVMLWLEQRFPGCSIHGVESGEEALEHARAARPDVVLMDLDLPGINGFEATSRMKRHAPEAVVVMLTMHDTPGHRLAAAAAGAVGYIAKVDMEEQLEGTVQRLLVSRAGASS